MIEGWVKIHRKICGWEWYKEPNTMHLFLHLLLNANYEASRWQGMDILPGQLVTGRKSLAESTGLSEQSIRTSLERLKSTNEITSDIYRKFSIITIINWDNYQDSNQISNHEVTTNQPRSNHELTTIEERKKVRKKEKKVAANRFEEFWAHFPRQRRSDKTKTQQAYEKALSKTTEDEIINSVIAYADSEEVAKRFAKAPTAWLNAERWAWDYGKTEDPDPDAKYRVRL